MSIGFSDQEYQAFNRMIGKNFQKYKCDPFVYSPMVYGIVGLYIDDQVFKITSLCERRMRFFHLDDMAVLRVEEVDEEEIKTYMDEGQLIETPVLGKIVSIDIVVDHQTIEKEDEKRFIDYPAGVIFHMEDTHEISFELKSWFSEMISIEKGYNLIEKFTPVVDFLEEWEGCEGYKASCMREVVSLGRTT